MRLPFKLVLAAPVVLLLYLYGLTHTGLLGPDEPRYAAIGREMAQSGDWLTPRLWGEAWFEKPALLYWLIAAGWRAGLGEELAPRLPVALVSVGFLVFLYLWTRREWGELAASYATAILATSAGWLAFSRVSVTDLPLAATSGASMLLVLPWVRCGGRRGLIAGGVLLGLAVLAKGLVPVVLAAPLLWVGRRRWRDLLMFATAALVVALPWYVACYLQNGWVFVEVLFVQHHFGRFLEQELQHVQPWWFYLPVLAGLMAPWIVALPAMKFAGFRDPRVQLLGLQAAWGLLFFSVSTNKLPGYVLPILPPIAVLCGIGLSKRQIPLAGTLASLLLLVVPVAAAVLPAAVASGLRRASSAEVNPVALAVIAAAALGVALIERRDRHWGFAAAVASAAGAVLWLEAVALPDLDRVASARPRWHQMERRGTTDCSDAQNRGIRYGLNYYAGRQLPACSGLRERNHDNLDRE
ncbi:MAG TPA: glycosyltransferase family 39 protein [Bryobacteraceae bacterium]|nr:glycosyltransferase family 39 protein [Bryobacteraceae bacterium]